MENKDNIGANPDPKPSELDINPKLVQNIKLAEVHTGIGTENVRAPRLPLFGEEREHVLKIIKEGIATRPTLPNYKNL